MVRLMAEWTAQQRVHPKEKLTVLHSEQTMAALMGHQMVKEMGWY